MTVERVTKSNYNLRVGAFEFPNTESGLANAARKSLLTGAPVAMAEKPDNITITVPVPVLVMFLQAYGSSRPAEYEGSHPDVLKADGIAYRKYNELIGHEAIAPLHRDIEQREAFKRSGEG